MRIALLSSLLLLMLAAPARADVLVNAPDPSISCGKTIKVGVWYRDFPTTGHRSATVDILSPRGIVLFHRHVQAPSQWKFWHYKPGCGKRYTVRYRTSAGVTTFHVRVKAAP
jgi:hypothetical protein